jgi:hypothetical protein
MKVYTPARQDGIRTIAVAPAAVDPTARVAEWQDDDGKPLTISVRFVHGVAEVADNLGRFLIAHGYAKKTRPLLYAA